MAVDKEQDMKVDLFGDYAETDLDQPTDYSLRYAEDDTDDDEKQSCEYFSGSVQEDTVKTYYTEGTPYETPFNFSTATSMSDLRLEDAKETADPPKKNTKKGHDLVRKESLSLLVGKETEPPKSSQPPDSDDRLMPDKMLDYYEATTSDSFSRANSLCSLSSAITKRNNVVEIGSKVPCMESSGKDGESERAESNTSSLNVVGLRLPEEAESPLEGKNNSRVMDKEGKMVTFSRQDYYAEQTPLMFSRCSSLGSLSGFEQHSIHDDRSSIVSDFSRRTSGIISPSELPDSPTQTIPPSPRNHKSSEFASKIQEDAVRPSVRHLSYMKSHATRSSVFEDDIATFKEESTPIEFSTATSLSSLTIDDEPQIPNRTTDQRELVESNRTCDLGKDVKRDGPADRVNNVEIEKDQEQVSDGDEDDEDMLAACISMGMQNNRYRQSFKTSTVQKPMPSKPTNMSVRYQRSTSLSRLEPRVPGTSLDAPAVSPKITKNAIDVVVAPDTVHVYCTEDTPADISPVGSQSNLSALSMPSVPEDVEKIEEGKSSAVVECNRNDLSDESSNLSGEDEKILDECIQSGMPKVRQITPPPTSCIPRAQKAEVLTQRFNICGTPSSSPVESATKSQISTKSPCRPTVNQENEVSDDSPNHSDDEAILMECIRSAMPKVRLNISSLIGSALSKTVEKSKAVNQRKSSSLPIFRPNYSEQTKQTRKSIPFEDNLSLSEEEEDIILAQCIRSGMPKALNVSSNSLSAAKRQAEQFSKLRNGPSTSSLYVVNKFHSPRSVAVQVRPTQKSTEFDEPVSLLGTGSCNFQRFSVRSADNHSGYPNFKNGSINTFDRTSALASCTRRFPNSENDFGNTIENGLNGSRPRVPNCRSPISNVTDNDDDDTCRGVMKSNVAPSRHSSVSSLSEEGSLGSIEEWALLELCISSGMPRNKYRLKGIKATDGAIAGNHEDRETITEDNYSICSYNSYVCKT